jgi:ribosomal protein L40E
LITRGRFTVNNQPPDAVFDTLVGACGELKAKMSDTDTLRHRIDGKSRTTAWRWGTKFHARVVRHFEDVVVEVYDNSLAPDDRFVKQLYKTFTKYMQASQLAVDYVRQIYDIKGEVDERLAENVPMPGEGAPLLEADIPDDSGRKAIPSNKVCRRCGTSNPPDSAFCNGCGASLGACPKCGHAPEAEMSFCTKCGSPLH